MSYTCPICQTTSDRPEDEAAKWCGVCQRYEDDFESGIFRLERRTDTTLQVTIPNLQVILALGYPKEVKWRLVKYINNLIDIVEKLDANIPSEDKDLPPD